MFKNYFFKKIILLTVALIFLVFLNFVIVKYPKSINYSQKFINNTINNNLPVENFYLTSPINNWQERITKKPFGIYITPQNSPVKPERFTGYHTGVDFETFPNEQDTDIEIMAICDGELLFKKHASGYGGVAVQSCQLSGQEVTIIYGHLKLSSISLTIGQKIYQGNKIGILGKGFSQETDGERKHLHLGIHKGADINIKGYVSNPDELQDWLDITRYLSH